MKLERQRRLQEEEKLGAPAFSVANECLEAGRHPASISPKVGRESKGKCPLTAYHEVAEGVLDGRTLLQDTGPGCPVSLGVLSWP